MKEEEDKGKIQQELSLLLNVEGEQVKKEDKWRILIDRPCVASFYCNEKNVQLWPNQCK